MRFDEDQKDVFMISCGAGVVIGFIFGVLLFYLSVAVPAGQ